jgi:DNA-binding beta-propeller fold protein YncE
MQALKMNRKLMLAVLAAAFMAGAGSLLPVSSALAAEERGVLKPPFGTFTYPTGIAVDQSTGNVYVADATGKNAEVNEGVAGEEVQVFGPEGGAPVGGSPSSLDGSGSTAKSFGFRAGEPTGLAFDSTDHVLYIPDVSHNLVDKYVQKGVSYEFLCEFTGWGQVGAACQAGGGAPPSTFVSPMGVAVDAAGDLYIGDGSEIYEFNPAGEEVRAIASPGVPMYLTVSASGTLYDNLVEGGPVWELKRSTLAGTVEAETEVVEHASGVAYDQATERLILDLGSVAEELNGKSEVVASFGVGVLSEGRGIAVNEATNQVYVVNAGEDVVIAGEGKIVRFGPEAPQPDVTTGSAEAKNGGATLEGVVNPDGQEVTSCEFEYGTSASYLTNASYGHTIACSSAPGSGSSPVAVSAKLTGLETPATSTTYYYRLVAGNANGAHYGLGSTVAVPPAVEGVATDLATELQGTGAVLNGSLEPNGLDTHAWFEYSSVSEFDRTSGSYGFATPHQDVGDASEVKAASASIAGLEPNTNYYYRLAAENTFGVTLGGLEIFTTEALPPVLAPPLPVSGITRVTATIATGVNPEKSRTTWRILYGETSAYGEHTSELFVGEGLGEQPVRLGLEGLRPDTTYHYAVQATNPGGTATGPDEAFTTGAPTPPGAVTGGVSNVTLTTATVAGTVEAEGLPTSFVVEFGTGVEYGTSIPGEAGAGAEPLQITVPLQYLAPGTTYHYRFVAVNSDGRTYGADQAFTTPVYSHPIVLPSTLPLIATPAIAFPTETAPTQKAAKKKTSRKKHKKGKGHTKSKSKRRRKGKRG